MRSQLRTKMTVTVLIIILISCLLISYFSYSSSIRLVEDSISQIATTVIHKAVDVIDMEQYERMMADPGETDDYYELRRQLNEVREMAGVEYLYTMSRKQVDGDYEYIYVVDGLPVGDENESLYGDVEEEIASFPKIVETFEKGTLQVEMSYSEEWGGSVSAYLPLWTESGEMLGIIGADIDVTEVYRSMDRNRNAFIVTILAILLISSIGMYLFIYYLLRPLKSLTNQVEKMGEGNLAADIEMNRTDEIGYLANAMNTMLQNLRVMIGNILNAAESVTSQSKQLTQASDEVNEASGQIAVTMQQLTNGMDKQANAIYQLTDQMSDFTRKIEEVNGYGQQISDDSSEILKLHLKESSIWILP